jgi:hypothetical protein
LDSGYTCRTNNNTNTIALLNTSTKAGNLRRGVVFPLRVWLAFEDIGYAIHGLAAQIAFAPHSSSNLVLAYAHGTVQVGFGVHMPYQTITLTLGLGGFQEIKF